jgi:hypothetical protein
MRREQVLKVCLNHFIGSDMKFSFKEGSNEKVILWTAQDFSNPDEVNGELLNLALRFKLAETAADFMRIQEEAKEAKQEKKLLEAVESEVLTYKESHNESAQDEADESSPVKSPTQHKFSFANLSTNPAMPKFTGFTLPSTPSFKPVAAAESSFAFNATAPSTAALSFNFGDLQGTSTPSSNPFQVPKAPVDTAVKGSANRALFGNQPSSDDANVSGVNSIASPTDDKSMSKGADDDDVIFVWEAVPSESQRKRALALQLPPTFFLYEDQGKDKEDVTDLDKSLQQDVSEVIDLDTDLEIVDKSCNTPNVDEKEGADQSSMGAEETIWLNL